MRLGSDKHNLRLPSAMHYPNVLVYMFYYTDSASFDVFKRVYYFIEERSVSTANRSRTLKQLTRIHLTTIIPSRLRKIERL